MAATRRAFAAPDASIGPLVRSRGAVYTPRDIDFRETTMASHSETRGHMDIRDQKETFHGFLMASVWTGGLIIQAVALLTLAFAIGAGWWAGFGVFVVIGVALGFAFKMGGVYWATQVALWVLLGLGGMIVPALTGAAG